MQRKYYEAYDDRYQQIHEHNLQWSSEEPSAIVSETIERFSFTQTSKLLEIGCGEGRDAYWLLKNGFDLLATDVSEEAINFCKKKFSDYSDHFQVADCINEKLGEKFDFIYAVAVIHMLVLDEDRMAFYSFIRDHLKPNGIALICTMGDGCFERQTDISTAFDIQARTHGQTGKTVQIASTSCRMVNFQTFDAELAQNGLIVIEQGITAVEPDFPQMMFAVIRRD